MTAVTRYPCTYLGGEVELDDARITHVGNRHRDVLRLREAQGDLWALVLSDPDLVLLEPARPQTRWFCRLFPELLADKYLVVIVKADPPQSTRRWLVTSFITRRLLPEGIIEWSRL